MAFLIPIRISDYFLNKDGQTREFYSEGGEPVLAFKLLPDGMSNYILKQFDWNITHKIWGWVSDWKLHEEPDGSLTEYCDISIKGSWDWFSDVSKITFIKGKEIKWAVDASGLLWPNPLQSTLGHLGSYGKFLCKAIEKLNPDKTINHDLLEIYMEQTFRETERATYHCRKGHGLYAITYYADNGVSVTISEKAFTPSGN